MLWLVGVLSAGTFDLPLDFGEGERLHVDTFSDSMEVQYVWEVQECNWQTFILG